MLHITPELVEAGYEMLRLSPPFNRWALPHVDEVVIHATPIKGTGNRGCQGEHWFDGKQHHIRINPKRHHTLASMLMTLAHEMIHMRESMLAIRSDVFHGKDFQRMARQVCKCHGFDGGQF